MVILNHHEVFSDVVDTNVFVDLSKSSEEKNEIKTTQSILTGFKCIKLQNPPRGQSLKEKQFIDFIQ
jgi:hypothetical protein